MILVFTADAWHSNSSKKFVGVFSNIGFAISACRGPYKLSFDDQKMLRNYAQTQQRELNLMFEVAELNQLIK